MFHFFFFSIYYLGTTARPVNLNFVRKEANFKKDACAYDIYEYILRRDRKISTSRIFNFVLVDKEHDDYH